MDPIVKVDAVRDSPECIRGFIEGHRRAPRTDIKPTANEPMLSYAGHFPDRREQ